MKQSNTYSLTVLLFGIALCGPIRSQSFVEVADIAGVSGGYGFASATEAGGVSFVDFNNDGWDDLTFCTENTQALKIFQNNNGAFSAVTLPGITAINEKKTVLWIDYDNDGDQDLYLVQKPQASRLYKNNGDMTFTDVTGAAGLPNPPSTPEFWTSGNSTSFCDYDRDGDLDFYLCRYRTVGALIDTNSFYRNNGDGTFTDITDFTGTNNGARMSFCSTFFDYDNDGWDDMYVVNDRYLFQNTLYHNNGNGTFTDVSEASGTNIAVDAMNAGIGDFDHNGYMDIYVTNSGPGQLGPSYLFTNLGDGTFVNVAAASGVNFNRNGWGGNFFDVEHDMDLDLYVSTSEVSYSTPNALYINQGDGTYLEPFRYSGGLGGIDTVTSHTNVLGDYNNDGLYDIANCNDNVFLFHLWKNTTVTSNHWFKLLLTGTHCNRDAIGAWIEMWIDGEKYVRSIQSQEAYCGQNSRRLIMSTGTHTAIDSLIVKWPIKVGNVPFHKQVVPGSQITMQALNTITESTICKTVTSPFNEGLGSLRAAIGCAGTGDTILISLSIGDTISLSGAAIVIDKNLVIRSASNALQPIRQDMISGPALIIDPGTFLNLKNIYLEGEGTLIENHGSLVLHGVSMQRMSGAPEPTVLNYGAATVKDLLQLGQ